MFAYFLNNQLKSNKSKNADYLPNQSDLISKLSHDNKYTHISFHTNSAPTSITAPGNQLNIAVLQKLHSAFGSDVDDVKKFFQLTDNSVKLDFNACWGAASVVKTFGSSSFRTALDASRNSTDLVVPQGSEAPSSWIDDLKKYVDQNCF